MPPVLAEGLTADASYERYVSKYLGDLGSADRDGDGLDAQDIAFIIAKQNTDNRRISIIKMLLYDYDGDLRVTRAELQLGTLRSASERNEATRLFVRYDVNGDGAVTPEEIVANQPPGRPGKERRLMDMLALDPDGDGRLTAVEMREIAQAAFNRLDHDRDGKLSRDEVEELGGARQARTLALQTVSCVLPSLADNAQLIAIGTDRGNTVPSLVLGSQQEETTLVDLVIEPGDQPLYLVLTSVGSVLWRLAGDTRRVSHAVVSSGQQGAGGFSTAGVIGLPADKVTISRFGCPTPFTSVPAAVSSSGVREARGMVGRRTADPRESARGISSIAESLGRTPDLMFADRNLRYLALPSGTANRIQQPSVPDGFDAESWTVAVSNWRGGFAMIDARQVVTRSKVEPYQVYPGWVGLSRLIGQGTIVRENDQQYRIVRPIPHLPFRLMSGMGRPLTLIFGRGVPRPEWDTTSGICFKSEETGQALKGPCR